MQTDKAGVTVDWKRVQEVKRECLELAARHAVEQQKRDQRPTVFLPFPEEITDDPKVRVTAKGPDALRIAITDVLIPYGQAQEDTVRFKLDRPMNLLDGGSGLAVIVETAPGASREVRLGMRLIGAGGQRTATRGSNRFCGGIRRSSRR